MRDSFWLKVIKTGVRWIWAWEWGVRRRLKPPDYRLGGQCEGCAKCCEKPTIRVGRMIWHLPMMRAVFLGWQARVNGFQLVEAEKESRSFSFRCTHFDWKSRRCDSYESRPFLCRDYPRMLLQQPWPEFFAGCGFRPLYRHGDGLREALQNTNLSEEKRKALEEKLRLR
jgi:hypothetical protein